MSDAVRAVRRTGHVDLMNEAVHNRIETILLGALERVGDERARFLESTCGTDVALRSRVLELIDAHDGAPGILDPVVPQSADRMIGCQVGRYSIKSVIGTGGMGAVYLAVQESPHRKVALKIMNRGIASRSALRRFEFESQILGRLRHPNVAHVYEAGTHDDGEGGVPYFAMEYVPNAKTLIDYARAKKLGTHERLGLFADVCDAIHHGHQKGIIHRDIKPGNILVDSSGEPRIIDFGVARGTDSDMAVTTLQTDVGQLIGTLQYMSPEQCEAEPDDLDTRSDVYALGVVLYELLTDRLPYDLSRAAIHEAARMIREEAPVPPSTLDRTLRGDVETIALKALEKDRDHRYQSAADLRKDIDRYLRGEEIEARRPSVRYKLGKFVRRNRALAAATGSVAVVLVLATIGMGVLTSWALRERTQSREAQQIADEVNTFLNEQLLAQANPNRQPDRNTTLREALDWAAAGIEGAFPDEPRVEAAIRTTIGQAYIGLSVFGSALPHLERAFDLREDVLGADDPETLRTASLLAQAMGERGRLDEAEHRARATWKAQARVLGEEHPETLRSLYSVGLILQLQRRWPEAEPLLRAAMEAQGRHPDRGPMHHETIETTVLLVNVLFSLSACDEALSLIEDLHERCVAQKDGGADHPDALLTLASLNAYIQECRGMGSLELEQLEETLERSERILGADHSITLNHLHNVATELVYGQDDAEGAVACFQRLVDARERKLGEDHMETYIARANLAWRKMNAGREDEALAILHANVRRARRGLQTQLVVSLRTLAEFLCWSGRPEEAEPFAREAIALCDADVRAAYARVRLFEVWARALKESGRLEEAESTYREALEVVATAGRWAPGVFDVLPGLLRGHGVVLVRLGRLDEAEPQLLRALEVSRRNGAPRLDALRALRDLYLAQGRFEDAQQKALETHAGRDERNGADHPKTVEAMRGLVAVYEAWHGMEPDEGHDVEAAEWRAKLPAGTTSGEHVEAEKPEGD
jgi:non-specific serine/threonine protein kinase/serine/threonine-protein kinase